MRLGVLGQLAQHDLARDLGGHVVVAEQEAFDELGHGHVETLVEHELVADEDPTLAHHEHVDAGDGLLAEEPDDVEIEVAAGDHLLALPDRLNGVEPKLDARGALVLEVVGGLAHRRLEFADDALLLALEELGDLADVLGVLLAGDLAHARPGAAPHGEVEARLADRLAALLGDLLPLHAVRVADGDDPAEHVDRVSGGTSVGVGAEVLRALAVLLARVLDRGERVGKRQRDERDRSCRRGSRR